MRLPLELPGRFSRPGGWAIDVTIRDFCPGGVFVRVAGLEDDYLLLDSRQLVRDDPVQVSFRLDGPVGPGVFDLHAKVARVIGGGVGIAFVNPDPAVLRVLQEEAMRTRPGSGGDQVQSDPAARGALTAPAEQLYSACAEQFAEFLRARIAEVFEDADEKLFMAARDAKSNVEQGEANDAQRELRRIRPSIETQFLEGSKEEVDELWTGTGTAASDTALAEAELSLVDTRSFDDWLTTKGIVTRWESRVDDPLYELAQRLSVLAGRRVQQEAVPFGVQSVCFAFHESVQNLGASKRSRETLFTAFEAKLVHEVPELLDALNQRLVEAGVLPNIERPAPGAPGQPRRPAPKPQAPPQPPAEAPPAEQLAPDMEVPGGGWQGDTGQWPGYAPAAAQAGQSPLEQAAAQYAPGPAPGPAQEPAQGPWQGPAQGPWQGPGQGPERWPAQGPAPAPGGMPPPGAPGAAPWPAGAAASAGAQPTYPPAPGTPSAPGQPGPGPWPEGVPGAAQPSPGYPGQPGAPVAPGAAGEGAWSFGPQPVSLAPPERALGQAYETARSLLSLQRSVGSALRGGPPVAATPPRAAQGIDEGARRQVLDALSRAQHEGFAETWSEGGPLSLGDRLREKLGEEGIEVGDAENDIIDLISGLMDAILDDTLIDRNVKSRMRKLSLPLLRAAMFDDGFMGNRAHAARQVVDRLGRLELPLSASNGADSLRDSVDPLVDRIVTEHEERPAVFADVLPDIDALLERQQVRYTDNVERLVLARQAQEAIVKTLRGDAETGSDGSSGTGESAPPWQTQAGTQPVPAQWRKSLERAARLEPGAVLALEAGTSAAHRATLAWVDQDRGTFVFVNGAGDRVASFTRQELALGLHRGTIDLPDSDDVPATERGIYSMLHGIHEKVHHEATHDPLTGLLNVKEFRSRLEDARREAVDEGTVHVACFMRIGSYEEIRDTCGRRAGDSLLAKLARVIEKHVGDRGVAGRIDEDQFILLYHNCAPVEASHLIERQRRSIEQSRCVYHGRQFTLSLATGIAPITEDTTDIDAVLASAEAACDEARSAGGNRTEVREDLRGDGAATGMGSVVGVGDETWDSDGAAPPGDSGGAPAADEPRIQPAPSVSLIELFEADRLALRCQPVRPIREAGGKPYHEILLGWRDGDGEISSAGGLIGAVEREGRMGEIDRWVIRSALQWMSANRRLMVKTGGFALNLSGNTLSEAELLAYVIQEFNTSKVPPGKVIFEVNESTAIDSLSSAQDFIRTMREYGCRFSIDDFGVGQTSFTYLKSLPVDKVKIDGQFVKDMIANPGDQAMVRSINEIAHLLGKETVAEFAESEEIITQLAELGVDYVQGHGVGSPFPLDDLTG